MNTINFKQITAFTEAEFEALKVQYGKAYIISITDEEKELHYAVVRPSRAIIAAVSDAAGKQDVAKVNELLVKNLIKLGDMNALEDGTIYLTVIAELGKLMEPAKSFLHKG